MLANIEKRFRGKCEMRSIFFFRSIALRSLLISILKLPFTVAMQLTKCIT